MGKKTIAAKDQRVVGNPVHPLVVSIKKKRTSLSPYPSSNAPRYI